ncbi:NmrA family NAD(P)-binding protein [Thermoactinospora rubra]|uniref:NmrA family NAD(P)-binding protein n=1 Tax=Thermoactinospora rubra TaxID=1088767 RepID=UPI000A1087AE|nr:NmrA family NAD(P)-binding protein [Thermoactinospora rubra]
MIVVTGPTGNVGAEVVELLREQDELEYRIAAHRPQRFPGAPVARLDYDDPATFDAVLDGVSTLFLLFPLPHPRTVRTSMIPFIDAAVRAGCRHIVYVSVPAADRSRIIPHHAVERHIEATGVGHTFLRCGYFMQNLCRAVSTHGVDIMDRGELPGLLGRPATTFAEWARGYRPRFEARDWS